MKLKPDKNQMTWALVAFLTASMVIGIVFLLIHINTIGSIAGNVIRGLSSIWYGIIIAYLFTPFLNLTEKKLLVPMYSKAGISVEYDPASKGWKRMRMLSVMITITVIIGLIVLFFSVVGPNVVYSVRTIASNFNRYLDNISSFFQRHFNHTEILDMLRKLYEERFSSLMTDYVQPTISGIMQQISKSLVSLVRNIFNFIIGIIVSVYLMFSKEKMTGMFKKMTYGLFNEETANNIIAECRFVHHTFIGFINGKIVDSVIIGILCFIGTRIIGTPFPILVSFIVGVTNVIPFFGPYIGAILGGSLVFMIVPIQGLYFMVFVILLQQFDGNILGPKILGNSTGLSSFWVLFAIMFFGSLFGAFGWVIGVPTFAVIFDLVRRSINTRLIRKGYPAEEKAFVNAAYSENGQLLQYGPDHDKYNANYQTDRRSLWNFLKAPRRTITKAAKEAGTKENDLAATDEDIILNVCEKNNNTVEESRENK